MARKPRKPAGTFGIGPLERLAREPLFWLDASLARVWVNRAWEELVGRSLEFVRGTVCRAHAPASANDPADLAASLFPPPETLRGEPASTPALVLRADGEPLRRLLEFWPFHDDQGNMIGILGLVRPEDSHPAASRSKDAELHVELLRIREGLQARHGLDGLVGSGPAHRRLIEQVRLAATTTTPVLIVGEEGTGKRLVARAIHAIGPGRDQPLIPCDCQALAPELLERQLFGATRPGTLGDASEASRSRPLLGADGAFLLREIVFLPRDLQIRVAGAVGRSGRLLATSSHEPDAALADGRMASEFYYSLTTLVLRLSPLRERRDEIPLLAQHFLEQANQRGPLSRSGFSSEALAALTAYDWPGNLRELARVVDTCYAQASQPGHLIEVADLPPPVRGNLEVNTPRGIAPRPMKPLDDLLIEIERRLIETAMVQSRGNKSRAADLLGISRPRLYRRIQELNMPDQEPASANDPEPGDQPAAEPVDP